MTSNPLFDLEFLSSLLERKGRTLYARVTALTEDELPIEYIEGKATGGNINIDGNSIVRRTCSLTLIAKEVNISDFYWGLKNKFKLEIGVQNDINKNYDDIIWFKQGVYIITSFNTSRGTSNYTINISGKDKMCRLNGDLGGVLPHTTDFGIEEYYDKTTDVHTYTSIPLKTIIREAVQNFGNELAGNIIINDLEDAGLELLEYRGDVPMYMFRQTTSDIFTNMTLNGNQPCYIKKDDIWERTTISNDKEITYDNFVDLEIDNSPTKIKLSNRENADTYTIAKIEYGDTPGYRLTDLTYAGDLIANVGETITSVLDKIVKMLGNFEYFYNLDGKFVFQQKSNYVSIPWLNSENGDELPANETTPMWSFLNSELITQFQNTPNIANLRNDFAVWGKKKTTSGSELDIHMRYAIDRKPEYYKAYDGVEYTTEDWDWRELIYRMALDYRKHYHDDDFLWTIAQNNPQWPDGHTGYEQYYTDMEGFWRTIYCPREEAEPQYAALEYSEDLEEDVFIKQAYRVATVKDYEQFGYKDMYILVNGEMKPFAESCIIQPNITYSYLDTTGNLTNITWDGKDSDTRKKLLNDLSRDAIYVTNVSNFYTSDGLGFFVNNGKEIFQVLTYEVASGNKNNAAKFIETELAKAIESNKTLYVRDSDNNKYIAYTELPAEVRALYRPNGKFVQELSYTKTKNTGELLEDTHTDKVYYYEQYYGFDEETNWANEVYDAPESLLFWFDFLDAEGSEMGKYAVNTIGIRSKAISDNDVKTIYYREIPQVIFQTGIETYEHQTGYTYIQLQGTMENLFTISSKGKSAKERTEELLYTHGYCAESVNLTAIPVYHLEPNSRITIQDADSGISGEYLVNKITIPLTYNGTMSITATKAVSDIT